MAAESVEYVIKTCCVREWDRPCEWVLAMPVLHFMRLDVHPFDCPETEDVTSPRWWGLQNLTDAVRLFRSYQVSGRLVPPMS